MQGIGIVVLTLGGTQLKRCLRGLTTFLDKTVVVNDGKKIKLNSPVKKYICPVYTKYPSACYNMGIRELLKDQTIEHVFIVNDTVEIIDDSVFQDYIDVANKTKLSALCFCKNEDDPRGTNQNTRLTVDLGDNTPPLTLNFGTAGNLVYLHKDIFKKVGFFDERYRAAMEWSDLLYRISQKNLSTPFLWFPHVTSVEDKLIFNDHMERYEDELEERVLRGMKLFYMKNKCEIKDLIDVFSRKDVIQKLKNKSRSS